MKYLSYDDRYWVLDIETDGLQPTVIYCVCVKNLKTEEELVFYTEDDFKLWLAGVSPVIVGHHVLGFDVPHLNRLWKTDIPLECCIDSLVLSYLYNPALDGGHSLDSWGTRLRFPKGDFSDFSKLSPEMVLYCQRDVELTSRVYKALSEKMLRLGYSELSCEIEHKIRLVINQQEKNGFWFNETRARDFLSELRGLQRDLTTSIQRLFPPVSVLVKTGHWKYNKAGGVPAFLNTARDRYDRVVILPEDPKGGSYEYHSLEEFNIGSPKQRVERLINLGWEPEKFTPKGFPKVDEDALMAFSEKVNHPEVKAMAEWLVLQGRSSMVQGWLDNLQHDSRIHGRVNSCGATTRRMTHSNPNTANIPSAHKAKYGKECRSLWGVEPSKGLVLVGYDASGLETAGLCHYLNNPIATEILLKSKPDDIHSSNAKRLTQALGRPIDREWGAKTSWYAWLYGAYPPKLGSIVKGPPSDGEIVIETFYRNVPGLKQLIDEVKDEFYRNNGRLGCVDGGYVLAPSASAALNYRIQSLGAIVMKLTSILLDEEARRLGIPFKKVGDIHDEGQLETEERFGDVLGNLAVDCITRAGRRLGLCCILSGSAKVGLDWSMTH